MLPDFSTERIEEKRFGNSLSFLFCLCLGTEGLFLKMEDSNLNKWIIMTTSHCSTPITSESPSHIGSHSTCIWLQLFLVHLTNFPLLNFSFWFSEVTNFFIVLLIMVIPVYPKIQNFLLSCKHDHIVSMDVYTFVLYFYFS